MADPLTRAMVTNVAISRRAQASRTPANHASNTTGSLRRYDIQEKMRESDAAALSPASCRSASGSSETTEPHKGVASRSSTKPSWHGADRAGGSEDARAPVGRPGCAHPELSGPARQRG